MSDVATYSEKTFENIKHINEYGEEFWYARELLVGIVSSWVLIILPMLAK